MIVNRCADCMEEITAYPCPHCGSTGPVERNPAALPPMTILNGQYLVGRTLGQGGFGITYLGCDLKTGQKVAIKEFFPFGHVMRPSGSGSALIWSGSAETEKIRLSGVETFLAEARKMHQVRDVENVVHVLQVFSENETAYIVMDYIRGITLKDHLQNIRRPLTWTEARSIFIPAIAAMAKMHRYGLVHRDLSPDNLMIQQDGTVTILDLGAAKDVTTSSGASMLVAKTGFSPMEQYTQRGSAGPQADVYAMAATLYYAVTGKIPTPSLDRMSGAELRWDYPGLQSLSPAVIAALQKAMALLPKDRTRTMDELLAVLVEDVRQEAQRLSGAETPVRQKQEKQKKPLSTGKKIAVGFICCAAVILLAVFCWFSVPTQGPASSEVFSSTDYPNVTMAQNGSQIVVSMDVGQIKPSYTINQPKLNAGQYDYMWRMEFQAGGKQYWLFAGNKRDNSASPSEITIDEMTAVLAVQTPLKSYSHILEFHPTSEGSKIIFTFTPPADNPFSAADMVITNTVIVEPDYPIVTMTQNGSQIVVSMDVGQIKPSYTINQPKLNAGQYDYMWRMEFQAGGKQYWLFAGNKRDNSASPSEITIDEMTAVLAVQTPLKSYSHILEFHPTSEGSKIIFTFTPPADNPFSASDMVITNTVIQQN